MHLNSCTSCTGCKVGVCEDRAIVFIAHHHTRGWWCPSSSISWWMNLVCADWRTTWLHVKSIHLQVKKNKTVKSFAAHIPHSRDGVCSDPTPHVIILNQLVMQKWSEGCHQGCCKSNAFILTVDSDGQITSTRMLSCTCRCRSGTCKNAGQTHVFSLLRHYSDVAQFWWHSSNQLSSVH